MKGLFSLVTAEDLRAKLGRDFAKLQAYPLEVDLAFNFFITAEHMIDWAYPSDDQASARRRLKGDALLSVCSHLANGAKHFEARARQHDSVEGTGRRDVVGFNTGFCTGFSTRYGGANYTELVVTLKGDAAGELGESMTALDLAGRVKDYWDQHPLSGI